MNNYITYNIDQSGICFLQINRPPVNALSYNLLKELRIKLIKLQNENFRILIIGTENPHFSAGADLKERKIMSKEESGDALDNFNDCFNTLDEFSKPVICLINGFCLGGGAELAASCDIRIGADDSIIGFPEVSIGIIPGAGGTQRLPRIIGISNAKYWIYTAKKFNAQESYDYGFLNFITTKDNLNKFSIKLANEIIKNAPIAVSSAKKAITKGYNKNINIGLIEERKAYEISLNTQDRDEALSAFNEKRLPIWRNK